MNPIKIKDVFRLNEIGMESLFKTGLCFHDAQFHFGLRMEKLISRCYLLLCMSLIEAQKVEKDGLPSAKEMCNALAKIDENTALPKSACAHYYCVVAVLLTMQGHDGNTLEHQSARASMLINADVLKF